MTQNEPRRNGRWTDAELAEMAHENHWDSNFHTLFILGEFKKKCSFPGEYYALRRAIKIIKKVRP